MKNKRNVLIAFILVCCLCLSIGYAALTDTLYVSGTAVVNVVSEGEEPITPFEKDLMENVYWSAASSSETGDTKPTVTRTTEAQSQITGASDTTDSTTKPDAVLITIPAGVLTSEGDSTTITATVKNESQYDISATLNAVTDTDSSNYYTITWVWADNSTGAKAIAENGTADVTITVTLTKAPIADTTATFGMTLTATATG